MEIKTINLNSEKERILNELDDLEPCERLLFMETEINKVVNSIRESLTEEVINDKEKKVSNGNPIKCECGGTLYKKNKKKN